MISSLHASVLASTYQYNCIEPSKNRWTHIIYATYIGLWQWVCVCVRACDVIKLIGIGESIPKKIKQIEVYIDILKFNSLPLRVPFHSDNNKIYTERQLNFIICILPTKDDNNNNSNNSNSSFTTKYHCTTGNSLMAALCFIVATNAECHRQAGVEDKAKVCFTPSLPSARFLFRSLWFRMRVGEGEKAKVRAQSNYTR